MSRGRAANWPVPIVRAPLTFWFWRFCDVCFSVSLLDSFLLSLAFKSHTGHRLPVPVALGGGGAVSSMRGSPAPSSFRGESRRSWRHNLERPWPWGVASGGPDTHCQSLLDWSSVRETDQVTKCPVTFWRGPSHNHLSMTLANHPHNAFHDCQRGWHRCVEGTTTLEMTSLTSEKSAN